MKTRKLIIALLFLLSLQTSYAQTKTFNGDTTAYWRQQNAGFLNNLKLKNLEQSEDEFNFRLWDDGQVIEIRKNNSVITGVIVNYIYHFKNNKYYNSKIIADTIALSAEQAKTAYKLIQNSEILAIPTDHEINGWHQGLDGITYTIEYSDKDNYWLKTYWTPSAQDSVPEATTVLNFLKNISDSLDLNGKYNTFKNTLLPKGCYSRGGISAMCFPRNTLGLGYSGSTKLPFGFYTWYSADYIGKTHVNMGAGLQYNFDGKGFYRLNTYASRWQLFYKQQNLSDFLIYNYQNNKINIPETDNYFQNHQLTYGLTIKNNVSIGVGIDYLLSYNRKIGGHLYAAKTFSKPNIRAELSSSLFSDQINYKVALLKYFRYDHKTMLNRLNIGVSYEDYMDYRDLYFKVLLWL